jgi:outer membrane immunogenic protein
MKKTFSIAAVLLGVATTASAADFPVVPVKAPLPAPVIFSWTGCYIGVEGGGNWGGSSQIARSGPNVDQPITGNFDLSGGIAGGTVGCNVQVSNFVIGAENDFSWTNKRGTVNDQLPFNPAATSSAREKWIDTLRGRFGYAIDRFMVYGTAGVPLLARRSRFPIRHSARSSIRRNAPDGCSVPAANMRSGPMPLPM